MLAAVVDAVLDGVQTTRWKATRQTTRWKATRHEEREVHVRQGGTSTLALISLHFPYLLSSVVEPMHVLRFEARTGLELKQSTFQHVVVYVLKSRFKTSSQKSHC